MATAKPTRFGARGRATAPSARSRRGFTLVELLVSIGIVATLLALLLPALSYTIGSARGFRCQMSLRSVAFDFQVFADEQLHGDRGDDPALLGKGRFRLETFQESQYGLDEFWRWGSASVYSLPDAANNDPMRCTQVRGRITLLKDTPCAQGAITPPQHVSYGFNARLHVAELIDPGGQAMAKPVVLTGEVMQHAEVPLVWDVDGAAAVKKEALPVFSAPSVGSTQVFGGEKHWFPGMRHNGQANFAFLGGHVLSSARPLEEGGWLWSFQTVK